MMRRAVKASDLVLVWAGMVALAVLVIFCTPQSAPKMPTLGLAEGECVGYRTGRQILCDVAYSTRQEIDACRAGVKIAVDCTNGGALLFLKDAGGDR